VFSENGTNIMTLDTEYTDGELYTNILGLIPPYQGTWGDGGDFWGAMAYSAIGADHADGDPWTDWEPFPVTALAILQEMEYRFDVPGSQINTEYLITWDLVTYDIWQGVINTGE